MGRLRYGAINLNICGIAKAKVEVNVPNVRIIGPGRAGRALAIALVAAGWELEDFVGRDDELTHMAIGPDLLVIATPDDAIANVANAILPAPGTVVAHLAGSLGLDVLGAHAHKAVLHPLVTIPNAEVGAQRLLGAWYSIAANTPGATRLIEEVVQTLHGQPIPVADENRAVYHAAAAVASNHLVALLAQVERLGEQAGVPLEAYLELVRMSVDNVEQIGPKAALTGPAARGDMATIARHLAAMPEAERPLYLALSEAAQKLAGHATPGLEA